MFPSEHCIPIEQSRLLDVLNDLCGVDADSKVRRLGRRVVHLMSSHSLQLEVSLTGACPQSPPSLTSCVEHRHHTPAPTSITASLTSVLLTVTEPQCGGGKLKTFDNIEEGRGLSHLSKVYLTSLTDHHPCACPS